MKRVFAHCNHIVLPNCIFEYILPGKLQTDNLKRRFGLYRRLCGANYYVSVAQVLEAEKSCGSYGYITWECMLHTIRWTRHTSIYGLKMREEEE